MYKNFPEHHLEDISDELGSIWSSVIVQQNDTLLHNFLVKQVKIIRGIHGTSFAKKAAKRKPSLFQETPPR